MITDTVIEFSKQFPAFDSAINSGLIVFARILSFMTFAPVLSRKEVPMLIKIAFSLILTVIMMSLLGNIPIPKGSSIALNLLLNMTFGAIIGFIATAIFAAINAGGDMINTQMGLSSAMMFDSSTKAQSSVLGTFLGLFGTVIFINIGGMYWLIKALLRSFDVFPIYDTVLPLAKIISIEYIVTITSNVLFVGLQIAAPILLATLGQDIILGLISKTAPQVNVFTLSFLFKPVMGAAIMVIILPMLVNVVTDYFLSFAQIY
jgi:flagellar biosynthetic protein FliR